MMGSPRSSGQGPDTRPLWLYPRSATICKALRVPGKGAVGCPSSCPLTSTEWEIFETGRPEPTRVRLLANGDLPHIDEAAWLATGTLRKSACTAAAAAIWEVGSVDSEDLDVEALPSDDLEEYDPAVKDAVSKLREGFDQLTAPRATVTAMASAAKNLEGLLSYEGKVYVDELLREVARFGYFTKLCDVANTTLPPALHAAVLQLLFTVLCLHPSPRRSVHLLPDGNVPAVARRSRPLQKGWRASRPVLPIESLVPYLLRAIPVKAAGCMAGSAHARSGVVDLLKLVELAGWLSPPFCSAFRRLVPSLLDLAASSKMQHSVDSTVRHHCILATAIVLANAPPGGGALDLASSTIEVLFQEGESILLRIASSVSLQQRQKREAQRLAARREAYLRALLRSGVDDDEDDEDDESEEEDVTGLLRTMVGYEGASADDLMATDAGVLQVLHAIHIILFHGAPTSPVVECGLMQYAAKVVREPNLSLQVEMMALVASLVGAAIDDDTGWGSILLVTQHPDLLTALCRLALQQPDLPTLLPKVVELVWLVSRVPHDTLPHHLLCVPGVLDILFGSMVPQHSPAVHLTALQVLATGTYSLPPPRPLSLSRRSSSVYSSPTASPTLPPAAGMQSVDPEEVVEHVLSHSSFPSLLRLASQSTCKDVLLTTMLVLLNATYHLSPHHVPPGAVAITSSLCDVLRRILWGYRDTDCHDLLLLLLEVLNRVVSLAPDPARLTAPFPFQQLPHLLRLAPPVPELTALFTINSIDRDPTTTIRGDLEAVVPVGLVLANYPQILVAEQNRRRKAWNEVLRPYEDRLDSILQEKTTALSALTASTLGSVAAEVTQLSDAYPPLAPLAESVAKLVEAHLTAVADAENNAAKGEVRDIYRCREEMAKEFMFDLDYMDELFVALRAERKALRKAEGDEALGDRPIRVLRHPIRMVDPTVDFTALELVPHAEEICMELAKGVRLKPRLLEDDSWQAVLEGYTKRLKDIEEQYLGMCAKVVAQEEEGVGLQWRAATGRA
eukprot:Sspe_Gene.79920::Locus_50234_Transcript_1_1_Confidence_1.000_Length_3116::g.79920::m.79920